MRASSTGGGFTRSPTSLDHLLLQCLVCTGRIGACSQNFMITLSDFMRNMVHPHGPWRFKIRAAYWDCYYTNSAIIAAGPIVRYGPNSIIFNDYELLAVAYGRRADKSDFFAANFDTAATFNRKKYEDHVAGKKAIATAVSHLFRIAS